MKLIGLQVFVLAASLATSFNQGANGQSIIVAHDFDRELAASELDGLQCDIGDVRWTANWAFRDDGQVVPIDEGTATLPIAIEPRSVYILEANFQIEEIFSTGDHSFAFGFADQLSQATGTFATGPAHGICWISISHDAASGESFAGVGDSNGESFVLGSEESGVITSEIRLDTRDPAEWAVTFDYDDDGTIDRETTIPAESHISSIGFSLNGILNAQIDSISLRRIAPVAPLSVPALPAKSPNATGLVAIAHGTVFGAPSNWNRQLAEAISQSLEDRGTRSSWDIVPIDWLGEAESDPWQAMNNAILVGRRLGNQIARAGYSKVHIYGHSAGAWIAHGSSQKLATSDSTFVQTTFFDAFTPSSASVDILGSYSDSSVHYFHRGDWFFTEQPLNTSCNIDVTALNLEDTSGHSWPYRWYIQTAIAPDGAISHGYGFKRSLEWGTALQCSNNLIALPDEGIPSYEIPPAQLRTLASFDIASHIEFATFSDTGSVESTPRGISLETGSPAWINLPVTANSVFNQISFEVAYNSDPGATGVLTVEFDGHPIAQIDQTIVGNEPSKIRLALPNTFTPGTYQLAIRLQPFSETASRCVVRDASFEYTRPRSHPKITSVSTTRDADDSLLKILVDLESVERYSLESSGDLVQWNVILSGTAHPGVPICAKIPHQSRRYFRVSIQE